MILSIVMAIGLAAGLFASPVDYNTPAHFESTSELKAVVAEYKSQREWDIVIKQDCYKRAYDMKLFFYQHGKNMDIQGLSSREYNKVFGQFRAATTRTVTRRYFCWCLVDGYEFWVEPLTCEIERMPYWAVGER